jgi:hypothetical protein
VITLDQVETNKVYWSTKIVETDSKNNFEVKEVTYSKSPSANFFY